MNQGTGRSFESGVVTIWNLKKEVRNWKCCYKWQRLNMQHVSVCLRWGRRKEIFKLYCRFKALESFLILSIIFLDFLDHWMATRAYPCAPHTLKTSCFLCELVPVQLRAVGGSLSPCFPTSPGLLVSVFKPLSAASPTYSSTSNSSLLSSNSR